MRRACGRASRLLYSVALWMQERAEALDHASVVRRPRPLRFETPMERMFREMAQAQMKWFAEDILSFDALSIFAERRAGAEPLKINRIRVLDEYVGPLDGA